MTCARPSPTTSASGRRACCANAEASVTWMFHPFEIAICGHSGSGKTTLIARLIMALAPAHRVGYAKHSGHDFQIDEPGKDTDLARAAGAVRTFITNDRTTAMTTGEAVDFVQRRTAFDDC